MFRWLLPLAVLLLGGCDTLAGSASADTDTLSPPPGAQASVAMTSEIGKALNIGATAPSWSFRAYYTRNGGLVHEEVVRHIAIKYAWDDFHDIPSDRFGGYWVGRMTFAEASTQQVSVSLSWSKAKIIINGETVFDGDDKATFTHVFRAGENVVEVEFANGWHTTEFKVTFQDAEKVRRVDADDLPGLVDKSGASGGTVAYAGIYESAARDTRVDVVVLTEQDKPALWLSSYEAVEWHVKAATDVPLVVVASYAPGSRVHGVPPDRVVYIGDRNPVPRSNAPVQGCGAYILAATLRNATGLGLTGYSSSYAAKSLTISPLAEADKSVTDLSGRSCQDMVPERAAEREERPRPPRSNWKFGQPVTTQR